MMDEEALIMLANNEEPSTSPSKSTCGEFSFEKCAEINSDSTRDSSNADTKQDVPLSEVKKIFESLGRGSARINTSHHFHKIRWSDTLRMVLVLVFVLAAAHPSAASDMVSSNNHGGYNVSSNKSTVGISEVHLWRWPFLFFGVGVTPTAISDEELIWGCALLAVFVFMCVAEVCLAALCRRVILHLPSVGLNRRFPAHRRQPQHQDEDFQSSFDPPGSVNEMPVLTSNDQNPQENTLEIRERRDGDVTISQAPSLVNVNEWIPNKAGLSGKVGSGVVEQQSHPSAQESLEGHLSSSALVMPGKCNWCMTDAPLPKSFSTSLLPPVVHQPPGILVAPTTSCSHPGTPLEFGASSGQDVKPFGVLMEHGSDEDIEAENDVLHEVSSAAMAPVIDGEVDISMFDQVAYFTSNAEVLLP